MFFVLYALFTSSLNDVGIMGTEKIIVFLIGGFIFELIHFLINSYDRPYLGAITASALSLALLSFFSALFISFNAAISFPKALTDLVLVGLVVAFVVSSIFSLFWHSFSRTETMIRLLGVRVIKIG